MFGRIDAFVRDVSDVASEDDLAEALAEISRDMGFAYFALTHHVDIRLAPRPAIRLANYPGEWVDYFDDQKLGLSDPVHRASHLTHVGFAWSRMEKLITLSGRDREVLELARAASATASPSPRTFRAKPTAPARSRCAPAR